MDCRQTGRLGQQLNAALPGAAASDFCGCQIGGLFNSLGDLGALGGGEGLGGGAFPAPPLGDLSGSQGGGEVETHRDHDLVTGRFGSALEGGRPRGTLGIVQDGGDPTLPAKAISDGPAGVGGNLLDFHRDPGALGLNPGGVNPTLPRQPVSDGPTGGVRSLLDPSSQCRRLSLFCGPLGPGLPAETVGDLCAGTLGLTLYVYCLPISLGFGHHFGNAALPRLSCLDVPAGVGGAMLDLRRDFSLLAGRDGFGRTLGGALPGGRFSDLDTDLFSGLRVDDAGRLAQRRDHIPGCSRPSHIVITRGLVALQVTM